MKASFNQVSALFEYCNRYGMTKIKSVLEEVPFENLLEMDEQRYKRIRNAICYNEPVKALALLKMFEETE